MGWVLKCELWVSVAEGLTSSSLGTMKKGGGGGGKSTIGKMYVM